MMTAEIPNITLQEIRGSLLAIPAFVPAMVCTGYLTAWATNLHNFRQRSLVERLFWSLPLSLGVSTIGAYWIGRFLSLNAVVAVFAASALACLALLAWEWRERRRLNQPWVIGFRPLGSTALALAVLWVAVAILSLVDWQNGKELYLSLTVFDHSQRVNWTESILRTGIPPANPYYLYKHTATMRYYYFWNLICATIARMWHLPVRAVFIASCIWSGFSLVAIIGLYLKHILQSGLRLRKQFLTAIGLLMVSGLDIFVHLWNFIYLHVPLPGYSQAWNVGQVSSWYVSLLFVPHHIAAVTCCMLAFLLAWQAEQSEQHWHKATIILAAACAASAFGTSVYVTFAFFLVMLAWAIWQIARNRTTHTAVMMAMVGIFSAFLLAPYLQELTHDSSKLHGPSMFGFAVRETVPTEVLLDLSFLHSFVLNHPTFSRGFANLLLLLPGITVELGFFLAVLGIYLIPRLRRGVVLTKAQEALIFIAATSLVLTSILRSWVLSVNDFGIRGALILQFVLLLLGSEVIASWKCSDGKTAHGDCRGLPTGTPYWLRSVAALAIIFGSISTMYQALMFRFTIPLVERAHKASVHDEVAGNLSHDVYISHLGYSQLDGAIARNAVVQFNPAPAIGFAINADFLGVNRQVAIASDKPWCGAELGGDPSGCQPMAAAIDALYRDAGAEQARETCRQVGIQYLVARVYDPVWTDKNSWVWTLQPVVQDEEFRALDCR